MAAHEPLTMSVRANKQLAAATQPPDRYCEHDVAFFFFYRVNPRNGNLPKETERDEAVPAHK